MLVFLLYWRPSLPKNSQSQHRLSKHRPPLMYFSLLLDETRMRIRQTKANYMTLFFCHHTIFILPSINNEIAFTGNLFLRNVYPALLCRALETKRFSFPSPDNHQLHPPTTLCSALFHMVHRKMKARCIASGITLGLCVQHGKES